MGNGKKALKGVMEYKDYQVGKMTAEEAAWIKQFYDEYHGGNAGQYDKPILTAKEHITEARRNYNSLYMDAFNVTRTLGIQQELPDDERMIYELAADDNDFETAFKQIGDVAALEVIMDQAVRDIEAGQDIKIILSRFHIKMLRLRFLINKEKRDHK